jgi:tetratricopeptide (TPR) repeat protein
MADLFASAVELHESGQFASAESLYRQVLDQDANHANALHLLGVLRHQCGDHDRAIELIGQAVVLRPSVAAFHANLAEAYRAKGELERAVGCCRMALRLFADYPEALSNLGLALHGLERREEAVEQLRRAIALRPEFAAAHNNLGVVLRELNQFDEALAHFQRAVELDPNYPPARTNLGQMLVDRGRATEALEHCEAAVRLQPDTAALRHNLGNALRALDRLVEARAAYLEALRLDPDLALAHAHLGLALRKEGEFNQALPWLKQAVELEPQNPALWEHLAELHEEREDSESAVDCWRRVIEFGEERAGPRLALGWALQDVGRSNEAREQYLQAARLEPDSARVELNLGGLHEELGELVEAEKSFRKALELQPAFAIPLSRLAILLGDKLPDADLAALEARLADPGLGEEPSMHLRFALARVLDARGDYDRAAACARVANATAARLSADRHRVYDPATHERFVSDMIAATDADFFARLSEAGDETRRPVFIFGLPRSGTTLIEQVLASHPAVHGAGELRLARRTFEALPSVTNSDKRPLDCLALLDSASANTLAQRHLTSLAEFDGGKAERVTDKMPDNYLYLGFLATLFPRATFVHCRRDLRDVAVSCWTTDFRSIDWSNTFEHLAARFTQYARVMDHWRSVLPRPIVEVDYADTVADLETVARRLLDACMLPWDPACIGFHQTRRSIRTASVVQVRQPIYKKSLDRWKNYERKLGELFALLPRA